MYVCVCVYACVRVFVYERWDPAPADSAVEGAGAHVTNRTCLQLACCPAPGRGHHQASKTTELQGGGDEGNKSQHNCQEELSAKMESSVSAECWCGKEMQMLLLGSQVTHKCLLAAVRLMKQTL